MTGNMVLNDSRGAKVVIYGAVLDELLRSPRGPAMKDMMRRGDKLQELAMKQIRMGRIGGSRYGNLRYSIVKRVQTGAKGMPTIAVGSEHPIALLHHEGSRPHMIYPRTRKVLRFPGNTKSGFVFARYVKHPGTKPNKYLTDNIARALAD